MSLTPGTRKDLVAVTVTAAPGILIPDWAAIIAVVLGVTTFAAAQGVTYPLISLTLASRGVSSAMIGFNAAAFAAGLASATLLIHQLTRLASGERLIVGALVGCSLALLSFWLLEAVAFWFVARYFLGLFAGIIFILSEAWLHAASPDRIRGRIAGMYGAGMCFGFAAGPLAIPLFGSSHGFAFAVTAVYVAAVAFLTALLGRRARTKPQTAPPGALLTIARTTPVLVVMVVAFGFADIAAISGMPVYFVKTGHSEAFAAFSVTAMALPTGLAQPFVGALLDRWARLSVAVGAGLITAATFLLMPLLESETAILVAFAVLGAASFGLYTSALTLLGERYSGGLLVAGTAVFSLSYAVGSAIGASVTGFAMDLLLPAAAPVVTGLVLLVLTASFLAGRRKPG